MKGAKDVGLGEKSQPRFKRNPHKAKAKWKKGKTAAAAGKEKKKDPKSETEGEPPEPATVGVKRRDGSGKQDGAKRFKGECAHCSSIRY